MADTAHFAYPLFGATVVEPISFGPAVVHPNTWDEWSRCEKMDVITEQAGRDFWSERLDTGDSVAAPPMLSLFDDDPTEPMDPDADADVVVLALRLIGLTRFLDPDLAVRVARGPGGMVYRRPGIYRLYAYSLLRDATDVIDHGVVERSERLAESIVRREAVSMLRPFRAMSAPQAQPATVAALAFPMIEGIFGRMNQRKYGLGFGERLRIAGVAEDHAGWLDGPGPDEGRGTRNALAHGREVSPAATARLREAVWCAVRVFVESEPTADGSSPVDRFRRTVWG